MSKRQADEINLINYRLDTLEKRLENIEKLVQSSKNDNINTELLNIVLSLVKPSLSQKLDNESPPTSQRVETSKANPTVEDCGSSFLFGRRKTVL
jgi:tetrahydromethanopterin S-methyltransferase subunit G